MKSRQVAFKLNVTVATVCYLIRNGKLTAYRDGYNKIEWIIDEESVENYSKMRNLKQ